MVTVPTTSKGLASAAVVTCNLLGCIVTPSCLAKFKELAADPGTNPQGLGSTAVAAADP
ncbi:MAG: hypothetical protein GY696_39815 [Gammaproteobacteria bacterium]|nr:hypothetical protein [Gammaproteobacteria bacterium]